MPGLFRGTGTAAVRRIVRRLWNALRFRALAWDEIYLSPPHADVWAAVAATFGLQYTVARHALWGPSYDWLRPAFLPMGALLLFASVGIGARRLVPEAWHRLAWYVLGWYWIVWGVGAVLGNPGQMTAWGTIYFAYVCWNNCNQDYRKPFALIHQEILERILASLRDDST